MSNQNISPDLITSVKLAHHAFLEMGKIKGIDRSKAVYAMAEKLKDSFEEILQANTLDLEMSREMAVPDLVIDWLKLTPKRLKATVEILLALAELPDPLQKVINSPYQITYGQNYGQLMPLGVIAFVYESFPDLAAIAAGLCIKTGNSLILRGSSEASNSNNILTQALQMGLEETELPLGCLQFLPPEQGFSIQDLVTQDQYLNLIIPYGRPSLIQQVTQLATAPVLKTAMGNCYLYWSVTGDLDLVRSIVMDSHASGPDPVNAIEKVLVNSQQKSTSLIRLFNFLQEQNFTLKGDKSLVEEFPDYLRPIKKIEWSQPFLNKTIAFKKIDSLKEAISYINSYSSGHANCLVTESYQEARIFAMEVDSSLVYINTSPRFYRYLQGSESVFLGISNQKGHRRGFISMETFTTVKQIIQGNS
jgi:glutamate-5-semialdehyde dehydrogenase